MKKIKKLNDNQILNTMGQTLPSDIIYINKLNELIDAVNELTSTKSLPYVDATFNPPYGKSKEQRRGKA